MNRRLAALASAALLAGSVGLAGPAQATGSCAGTGTMELSGGIGLYLLFPAAGVSFDITIDCLNGGSIHAWGELDASCGKGSGDGWLDVDGDGIADYDIDVDITSDLMTISGGADGTLQMTPTVGNCAAGTATQFQVTGTISW